MDDQLREMENERTENHSDRAQAKNQRPAFDGRSHLRERNCTGDLGKEASDNSPRNCLMKNGDCPPCRPRLHGGDRIALVQDGYSMEMWVCGSAPFMAWPSCICSLEFAFYLQHEKAFRRHLFKLRHPFVAPALPE